jgi:hypothetical protein
MVFYICKSSHNIDKVTIQNQFEKQIMLSHLSNYMHM